eukprot:m.105852 g.105852  ORF g.105852 m.105852 type:complete len:501 (-) comp18961_c0_seq1:213-1715(-)
MKLAIFCLALCAVALAKVEEEEGVLIGTDDNLESIIADNEYALIEFYAPWCGHCKQLAPEYASAAQTLAKDGSAIKLVKVDATVHTKSGEKYEVQGYPTLKFFKKGRMADYTGGRSAADIVAWVNKKAGPPAVVIDTVAAAKEQQEKNDVFVLGLFNSADSDEAKAFTAAADMGEIVYGISTSADVAKEFGVAAPKIVLFKKFDEGRNDYDGKYDADAIHAFVGANSMPLVVEFSDESAQKIFGGDVKNHLILFVKKSSSDFKTLVDAMSEAAKDHKGKILFIYINSEVSEHERIMEFFSIKEDNLPTVRLIDLANEMAKYAPADKAITAASLKTFAQDFLDGKLKKHLMSEPAPADWDAKPVKVLTGENFNSVVGQGKNVLVEFYAPWCGHCKQLVPTWDKLGAKYEGKDSVVIAKIDSTANEIDGVSVRSFPTIKLFKAGQTEPVDYDGQRDLAGFVAFLEKETGVSVPLTEEEKASATEPADEDYEEDSDENVHEDL